MTQEEVKTIHEEIDSAIRAIGRMHGFAIDSSNITYDDIGFRLSLRVNQLNADGSKKVDSMSDVYIRNALGNYGVEIPMGQAIGFQFYQGNDLYEITDYNTRARKYPIEYKRVSDGACYKAAPEYIAQFVRQMLAKRA